MTFADFAAIVVGIFVFWVTYDTLRLFRDKYGSAF